jgi:hypothetical protein
MLLCPWKFLVHRTLASGAPDAGFRSTGRWPQHPVSCATRRLASFGHRHVRCRKGSEYRTRDVSVWCERLWRKEMFLYWPDAGCVRSVPSGHVWSMFSWSGPSLESTGRWGEVPPVWHCAVSRQWLCTMRTWSSQWRQRLVSNGQYTWQWQRHRTLAGCVRESSMFGVGN